MCETVTAEENVVHVIHEVRFPQGTVEKCREKAHAGRFFCEKLTLADFLR